MLTARRYRLLCAAIITLTLLILQWPLLPYWRTRPGQASSAGGCPRGRFVTINPAGRLGNKLCQYASLWALQLDDASARPAWVLPEMHDALVQLFSGLTLPALSRACQQERRGDFWTVPYFRYGQDGPGPSGRPVLLSEHPCEITRFHRHRPALLDQLRLHAEVREAAQRRLRRHTAQLCRGPQSPACTYIGVHVRRTDYGALVRRLYNGTLAGETYLTRALELCRRRYRRPVFVVCSDDLDWVRRRVRGQDVVVAGAPGADAAGQDLALLAQCNHTVMTHGTFGFTAALLAGGDVVVPQGFGERESFLSVMMRQSGFNLTAVHV